MYGIRIRASTYVMNQVALNLEPVTFEYYIKQALRLEKDYN